MNTLLPSLATLVALLVLAGCGEKNGPTRYDGGTGGVVSPSEARKALDADLALLMTDFGQAVKGVHDETTWADAKPRIEEILAEIPRVTTRLNELPEVPVAQYKYYAQRTKAREEALEKTLGDRTAFLAKLPDEVAAELLDFAQRFYNVMGDAQSSLCGPPPPVRRGP